MKAARALVACSAAVAALVVPAVAGAAAEEDLAARYAPVVRLVA